MDSSKALNPVGSTPSHYPSVEETINSEVHKKSESICNEVFQRILNAVEEITTQTIQGNKLTSEQLPASFTLTQRLCREVSSGLTARCNPTSSDYNWSELKRPDLLGRVVLFLTTHSELPKHKIPLLVSELQSALSDQPRHAQAIQSYIVSSRPFADLTDYLAKNQQLDLLIKSIIKMQGLSIGKIEALANFTAFKNLFPYLGLGFSRGGWMDKMYSSMQCLGSYTFSGESAKDAFNRISKLLAGFIKNEQLSLLYEIHKAQGINQDNFNGKSIGEVLNKYSQQAKSILPVIISAYDQGLISSAEVQAIYNIGMSVNNT